LRAAVETTPRPHRTTARTRPASSSASPRSTSTSSPSSWPSHGEPGRPTTCARTA